MIHVGIQVARHCDKYIETKLEGHKTGFVEKLIEESKTSKGRLLHYFPLAEKTESANGGEDDMPSWCGWHLDHSMVRFACPRRGIVILTAKGALTPTFF